jgi:hypothetical protein
LALEQAVGQIIAMPAPEVSRVNAASENEL